MKVGDKVKGILDTGLEIYAEAKYDEELGWYFFSKDTRDEYFYIQNFKKIEVIE